MGEIGHRKKSFATPLYRSALLPCRRALRSTVAAWKYITPFLSSSAAAAAAAGIPWSP